MVLADEAVWPHSTQFARRSRRARNVLDAYYYHKVQRITSNHNHAIGIGSRRLKSRHLPVVPAKR
jgi:hypothetical protein